MPSLSQYKPHFKILIQIPIYVRKYKSININSNSVRSLKTTMKWIYSKIFFPWFFLAYQSDARNSSLHHNLFWGWLLLFSCCIAYWEFVFIFLLWVFFFSNDKVSLLQFLGDLVGLGIFRDCCFLSFLNSFHGSCLDHCLLALYFVSFGI